MSDYPDDPYDDNWDDSFEGSTPASGSTPVQPEQRAVRRTRPPTGEYEATDRASQRRPPQPYDAQSGYSRPAIPRQARQARPIPPPPEPSRGMPIDQVPAYPDARGRRRPAPQRPSKRDSGLYLPWWTLLIMLIFVGAAAVGAWAVVGMIGGDVLPGGQTPIMIVVTATFTVGPPAPPTPIPQPPTDIPPVILPTIAPTTTLPPGEFRAGVTVEVVGVGIDGLNVRAGPGVSADIRFRANDGDRFVILSGPQTASGLEWWELQSAADATRRGWAARPYLQQVTSP